MELQMGLGRKLELTLEACESWQPRPRDKETVFLYIPVPVGFDP